MKPANYQDEVTRIWMDYYHRLTGRDDKPHYEDGCLMHWVAEYAPRFQTDILYICYEAGYKAGYEAAHE